MAPTTEYKTMPEQYDSTVDIDGYTSWTSDEVADYFEASGLGNYREVLIYHKIVRWNAFSSSNSLLDDFDIFMKSSI